MMRKSFADCVVTLQPWIDGDKIDWGRAIRQNPHAFCGKLLRSNPIMINWNLLSGWASTWSIAQLQANPDKINWGQLSSNEHCWAIAQLQANPDKIDWKQLAYNRHTWAVEQLLANPDKIDWRHFGFNDHPAAVEHMRANLDKINWTAISCLHRNYTIQLMQEHPDKIEWGALASNEHPWAVSKTLARLAADQLPVSSTWLSLNSDPQILQYLEAHPEHIDWNTFSMSPEIFRDEYDAIAREFFREHVAAELMAHVWHPRNMSRFAALGF